MNLTLRLETPDDHRAVEELTREAFWGFTRPTCDEHYLLHRLRQASSFVPELDYVAEADGRLAGNIVYSRAKVIDGQGVDQAVLTFGPLSVLPAYWHRGVGSALMRRTLAEAKRLGHRGVVVYGHPDYYPRFGFCNAKAFGITTPTGKNFDSLMAMPLYDGALDGVSGAFHEDPLFAVDAEQAAAYDRNFPHKEPARMLPIGVLLDKLAPRARQAFIDREITTLAWLNRFSGREMLTWDGIDEAVLNVINHTLKAHGYAEKLLPTSAIFRRDPGCCLAKDTLVKMADGSDKPIEQLRIGDRISTSDHGRGLVANIWRGTSREPLLRIGCGESSLTATGAHPLLTREGWKRAAELCLTDWLRCADGEYRPVKSLHPADYTEGVYNLELDGQAEGFVCNGLVVGDFARQNRVGR